MPFHLIKLLDGKTEHEVFRKAFRITFDGLVEHLGFDAIELRKIVVQHDPVATEKHDLLLNASERE